MTKRTRPLAENLRFNSSTTGEHVLDEYLEAAEIGGKTLAELMGSIFNSTGDQDPRNFEYRITPDRSLQFRVGIYVNDDEGWESVTNGQLLHYRGQHLQNVVYKQTDLVKQGDDVYICLDEHTSGATLNQSKFQVLVNVSEVTALRDELIDLNAAFTDAMNALKQSAADELTGIKNTAESNMQASLTAAQTSEANAKTSELNAKDSETAAIAAKSHAITASMGAEGEKTLAQQYANDANQAATQAAANRDDSLGFKTDAQSAESAVAAMKAEIEALFESQDHKTRAVIFKGDWDASSGDFPPTPTTPETVDLYRIIGTGRMSDGLQQLDAVSGQHLAWHIDNDLWYVQGGGGSGGGAVNSVDGMTGDVVIPKTDSVSTVSNSILATAFGLKKAYDKAVEAATAAAAASSKADTALADNKYLPVKDVSGTEVVDGTLRVQNGTGIEWWLNGILGRIEHWSGGFNFRSKGVHRFLSDSEALADAPVVFDTINKTYTFYGVMKIDGVHTVYHTGFKPTAADIGAAPVNHSHTPASIGAASASHTHTAADITGLPTSSVTSVEGQTGAVVLPKTDATDNSSTTTFATANGVKKAWDKAVEAFDKAVEALNSGGSAITNYVKTIMQGSVEVVDGGLRVHSIEGLKWWFNGDRVTMTENGGNLLVGSKIGIRFSALGRSSCVNWDLYNQEFDFNGTFRVNGAEVGATSQNTLILDENTYHPPGHASEYFLSTAAAARSPVDFQTNDAQSVLFHNDGNSVSDASMDGLTTTIKTFMNVIPQTDSVGQSNIQQLGFMGKGLGYRYMDGNAWTPWEKVFTSVNKPTTDDIVGMPKITNLPDGGDYSRGSVNVGDVQYAWCGYKILGRFAFIAESTGMYGLYDDVFNQWGIVCHGGAQTELYYNGAKKLATTTAGVTVTGEMRADTVYSNGDVTAFSDARLKTNVSTITNALEKVQALRGVEYDRLDRDGEHQLGFIAQEVEQVLPDLVHTYNTEKHANLRSLAYANMTAVLVEAIKELAERVEELERAQ